MIEASSGEPAPEPPAPKRLRDAVLDALLGLVKLVGVFLPELVLALLGAVVGLAVGIVEGAILTEGLFEGPGVWARAGPIALLIPLMTALGPPILGLAIGLVAPPVVALVPHSLGMVWVAATAWRDRYAVLFTTTAFVWLPGLLFAFDGLKPALIGVLVLSPLTAAFGFSASALVVAARGVLDGRSVPQFWRDADGSMVLTTLVLTTYAALITAFACALVCFLPTVPLAIGIAVALGLRLVVAGRHRGLAVATLLVNALLALVLSVMLTLAVRVVTDRPAAEDASGTASGIR